MDPLAIAAIFVALCLIAAVSISVSGHFATRRRIRACLVMIEHQREVRGLWAPEQTEQRAVQDLRHGGIL